MRKSVIFLLTIMLVLPYRMAADSYQQLWKQVAEAERKDLPKTQIRLLQQIVDKAETASDYGQMLKAGLRINELWTSISTDSIAPAVARTEARVSSLRQKDPALAAVYYVVIGSYYKHTWELGQDYKAKADSFFAKAMANPALLAARRAADFEPFVVKGRDSQVFDHDLLSLLGYQCEAYKVMHDYYKTTSNRAAAVLTAVEMVKQQAGENGEIHANSLKKSRYAARLDSLINLYSDLKACGEAALERFYYMQQCTDVTPKDCYNYANWALNKWGEWPTMNHLRNHLRSMTQPVFRVSKDNAMLLADTPFSLKIRIRNYNTLNVNITKTNLSGGANYEPLNDNWLKEMAKHKISGTTTTLKYNNVGHPEYDDVRDSLVCKGLPAGVYMIDAWADNNKSTMQSWFLYVTNMYVVNQKMPDKKTRFVVLNAKTGQPVPNASLSLRWDNRSKTTVKCDSKGETIVSETQHSWMESRAYTFKDDAMPFTNGDRDFYYRGGQTTEQRGRLYTDRSIYRPGQTVHASLLAYTRTGDDTKVLAGKEVTFILRNANYKTVEEKQLTTDTLGNASADFTLPSAGLAGRYYISAKGISGTATTIRVEEYKRPTFMIELPEINQRYQNGDTLVVTGTAKTYAGVPVQGATVKYTVRREQALWWRTDFSLADNAAGGGFLMEQTVKTDSTGTFKMELPMILPERQNTDNRYAEEYLRRIGRFYNIKANVQVTDMAGETRQAEMSVPLGSKPACLTVDLPSLAVRDSLKALRFNYRNMAGKDISGTVRYTVDGSNTIYKAATNKMSDIEWNTAALLKSGRHTLKAICGTDTLVQNFTVFSINDTVPCTETHDWFYVSARQFDRDNTPVYVQIGSSDSNVHVLYTAISGDKVLESGTFELCNSIKTKPLIYNNIYGDGLLLNFAWMKEGKLYTHSQAVAKPQPDKCLNVKWLTFRDRTVPGTKEEWTLNVTKPDGTPADASLMATLYDASLDQITPHSWNLSVSVPRRFSNACWAGSRSTGCYLEHFGRIRSFYDTELHYSSMDFNPVLGTIRTMFARSTRAYAAGGTYDTAGEVLKAHETISQPMLYESGVRIEKHAAVKAESSEDAVFNCVEQAGEESMNDDARGTQTAGDMQLRENLNETAYFAPTLRTDSDGNVTMSFTLPESITTWRFWGLVHDRNMNYGSISGETVAKKTVMIQPNMPRFVRSGDKATITARLFNTSENAVSGTARLQLTDPETEAVVMEKSVPFKTEGNGTSSVSFSWQTSDAHQLLICRVTAAGKSFSDGEQHYLPVLPDKEMILNTVPFTQTAPGTQTVDLKSLFPKGSIRKKLTVEYTNNPAWLVIQALPYIGTARDKSITSLSTAFYANTLGSYIVSKTPQLKSVFEMWKREPAGTDGSLASALDKNQELKTMVSDETPWLNEAETEAAQKRNLSNYFDINMLQSRNTELLADMRKLQRADGAWSWWPGMDGSPCLTMTVARQLARLQKLTDTASEAKDMLAAAQNYIGRQAVKEYEQAKKNMKRNGDGHISESFALNYLYINALTGRKPTAKEAEAAGFMLAQLKKADARTDLYTKALMAVVLAQNGETALARQYLKSLEEYSVATETMGRYYDTGRAGYSWCDYRIPTQVAAIEAMTLVAPQEYRNTVTEMQRWLLQQKHTQGWDTPVQSADAVFAFLNGNSTALQSQPQTVLKVDGRQLETSAATAGIGYVKTTVSADRVSKLTAEKTSAGTSWGAVYAQSMQKTAEINASKSGLSITRELISDSGKPAKELKTGDRVRVRITVKADRNYDFVMVKDNRAACMEPVEQLSGYRNGCYCVPKDNATYYYFDRMAKGTHTLETAYYIDRAGLYETGTCSVQCAYAPEYTARTASMTVEAE